MKKLQNYLMKPEELRKKLENPRFRRDFIEWSKGNVSINRDATSKCSRSKSPVENIQRSMQLNPRKTISQNKENIRPQSGHKQSTNTPNTSQRTPLTLKMPNADRVNRSETGIKRNVSNAMLVKGIGEQQRSHYESLNGKNKNNSCTSINYQSRQRATSHTTSVQEKKVKQRYSYRTRQGVQITNPNKVNQDSLVIKTNLADKNTNLYAVADGHGTLGHLVSQYLVKNISKCF
jgi:hypothetical protein